MSELPAIDEAVPCTQCGDPMVPDRARWWTGYGSVCSEWCARDLIRDHEGGIQITTVDVVPERCDCGAPLASPEEMESGLCLRCLNGPVPGDR